MAQCNQLSISVLREESFVSVTFPTKRVLCLSPGENVLLL